MELSLGFYNYAKCDFKCEQLAQIEKNVLIVQFHSKVILNFLQILFILELTIVMNIMSCFD